MTEEAHRIAELEKRVIELRKSLFGIQELMSGEWSGSAPQELCMKALRMKALAIEAISKDDLATRIVEDL